MDDKKKFGLVLPGGGAAGIYQYGVLEYMFNLFGYNPFDFIAGTSVGSLNGAIVAADKMDRLGSVWFSLNGTSDLFKKRWLGYFGFLFGADSYMTSKPLRKIVRENITLDEIKATGREFVCAVYNTRTLQTRYISAHRLITDESLWNSIVASSSIPFLVERMQLKDTLLVPFAYDGYRPNDLYWDGGVREVTPLSVAIKNECDVIYVIRCTPTELNPLPKNPEKLDMVTSLISALVNENYKGDVHYSYFVNSLLQAYSILSEITTDGMDESEKKKLFKSYDLISEALEGYREIEFHFIDVQKKFIETTDFNGRDIRDGYQLAIADATKYFNENEFTVPTR